MFYCYMKAERLLKSFFFFVNYSQKHRLRLNVLEFTAETIIPEILYLSTTDLLIFLVTFAIEELLLLSVKSNDNNFNNNDIILHRSTCNTNFYNSNILLVLNFTKSSTEFGTTTREILPFTCLHY